MIRLHFAPLTRSIRIRWLLEELEVAYELTRSEFNRETQKGFSQATPSGNYPYMEDGSVTLSESGAVCQRRSDSRPLGRSKSRPVIARGGDMKRGPIGALFISTASCSGVRRA